MSLELLDFCPSGLSGFEVMSGNIAAPYFAELASLVADLVAQSENCEKITSELHGLIVKPGMYRFDGQFQSGHLNGSTLTLDAQVTPFFFFF